MLAFIINAFKKYVFGLGLKFKARCFQCCMPQVLSLPASGYIPCSQGSGLRYFIGP